jgi:hypothetical protein
VIERDEVMRYVDNELPPERRRAVESAAETDTEVQREIALYRAMREDLKDLGANMRVRDHSTWAAVNRMLTRPVGWGLFLVGALIWVAYAVYTYMTGGDALWEKLATSAVVLGLGLLFLSTLIDRYQDLKTDPYKEIQR